MATKEFTTIPSPDVKQSTRCLTVGYVPSPSSPPRDQPHAVSPHLPYLRLKGRWLDHAGFIIGTRVHVRIEKRRLIIESLEEAASEA